MRLSHVLTTSAVTASVAALILIPPTLSSDDPVETAPLASPTVGTSDAATPEEETSEAAGKDDKAPPAGKARPDVSVAALSEAPLRSSGRSATTAVETFIEALIWAVDSTAAKKDPRMVSESMGDTLNVADETMLEAFDRSKGVALDPSSAYYRVLGFSGPESSPDQVMVEVSMPMTIGTETQNLLSGGVVARGKDGRWQIISMRPREFGSPAAATATDQTPGLGWQTLVPATPSQ